MKTPTPNWTPPDVECIQKFGDRQQDEVNERMKRHGWVLLGILYERKVQEDGSFKDSPTYILGGPRASAQRGT